MAALHSRSAINDRGVCVDMDMVQPCHCCRTSRSREKLTAQMRAITNLDNPKSVQQMKRWLSEHGLETDTLGKQAVTELLKNAPEPLSEVLELRQQLCEIQREEIHRYGKCRLHRWSCSWDVFSSTVLTGPAGLPDG